MGQKRAHELIALGDALDEEVFDAAALLGPVGDGVAENALRDAQEEGAKGFGLEQAFGLFTCDDSFNLGRRLF
jgi:hypothetical protein